MSGRIKLYRQSQDNPLYFAEPFTKWQAWQDLLLIANHADGFFFVRGNKIEVQRGQIARGENDLCQRRKWSRDKVRNFLKLLENMGQIIQQKNRICSLYIIVNYDKYQTTDQTTDPTTEKQQTLQQKNINKKKENENNKNNEKEIIENLKEKNRLQEKYPDIDEKRLLLEIIKMLERSKAKKKQIKVRKTFVDNWLKKGYQKDKEKEREERIAKQNEQRSIA